MYLQKNTIKNAKTSSLNMSFTASDSFSGFWRYRNLYVCMGFENLWQKL